MALSWFEQATKVSKVLSISTTRCCVFTPAEQHSKGVFRGTDRLRCAFVKRAKHGEIFFFVSSSCCGEPLISDAEATGSRLWSDELAAPKAALARAATRLSKKLSTPVTEAG